jgi:prolyl-tRNA editing enzyme YbaK/EbsC (Cys-tRNA(Pro) deacylase)
VVLQYVTKLTAAALEAFLASRGAPKAGRLRLAPPEVARALTGSEHNGVSLFGHLAPVPIVVAEPVAALPVVWLGGGEPDLKLRLFPVALWAWAAAPKGAPLSVHVVDCVEPREEGDAEDF